MTSNISPLFKGNSLSQICEKCLQNDFRALIVYGLLILLLWLFVNYKSGNREPEIPDDKLPLPPSDLRFHSALLEAALKKTRKKYTDKLKKVMSFFELKSLYRIVRVLVSIIEYLYGIRGNAWDYLRAFKTALVFYLILIPLPAAFMPPVGGVQIRPSLQLLVATLILIFFNAVGDMFSVNFSARVFRRALIILRSNSASEQIIDDRGPSARRINDNITKEIKFYLLLLFDLSLAACCLIFVLMGSSVMYGIQVGEFGFSGDRHTLSLMMESALHFWRLSGKLYWFANDPDGFLGQPGIPGMLAFSLTTFLPTLFIGLAALLWLFILPVRIVLKSRLGKYLNLVVSQAAVFAICVVYAGTTSLDIRVAYAFLTTTWAT